MSGARTPRTRVRAGLAAGCLLMSQSLAAQAGRLCPEFSDRGGTRRVLAGRAAFQPHFERETRGGAELAAEVDGLFRQVWEQGLIQPRAMFDEVVEAATRDVGKEGALVRDDEAAEAAVARQVARLERYRDALRAIVRGHGSWSSLLSGFRSASLRLLLACPETLRDRHVMVMGTVWWERSERPPHDVVRLRLEQEGIEVPLVWAGVGPVAEIHPQVFARSDGAYSGWWVSVHRVNGADVFHLHDFLGIPGVADPALAR